MVYKFRIISDEVDDFLREIKIASKIWEQEVRKKTLSS